MMPFSSSLSQYVSEIQDLEMSGRFSNSSENLERRNSPLSSFEIISSISDNSGSSNYIEHPLLSEREAIKIRAQVMFSFHLLCVRSY